MAKKKQEVNTETETDEKARGDNWTPVAAEQILSYIERVERLEEEKAGIATDIREVFAEAKGNGFDVPTLRLILKNRKIDQNSLMEKQHLYELYTKAIGMLPLESFAADQEEKAEQSVIKIVTKDGTIETDVTTFLKAGRMTKKIVDVLGAIYTNQPYTPATNADVRLMAYFKDMGLVTPMNDGSFCVTPKAVTEHLTPKE